MNENIDLTKILKDCPKGTILYSLIHGYVKFSQILNKGSRVIEVISITKSGKRYIEYYTFRGKLDSVYNNDECVLFPSKEQRDWSKFTAPWYKKDRFDPKTLNPFDKVLVFDNIDKVWSCDFYSHKVNEQECFNPEFPYICVGNTTDRIIPYNDETKHLVGTTDEAPEFYRYWEE